MVKIVDEDSKTMFKGSDEFPKLILSDLCSSSGSLNIMFRVIVLPILSE